MDAPGAGAWAGLPAPEAAEVRTRLPAASVDSTMPEPFSGACTTRMGLATGGMALMATAASCACAPNALASHTSQKAFLRLCKRKAVRTPTAARQACR